MSYLVLARKHRPVSFDELIGQEHISKLLKQAITSERIAHAYLFTGPRGVGKTSCARILAQCLNCTDGPKINPPTDDPIVESIAKGNSFDVLEIDGASNRGIDEVRMLRENVKFAPSVGRYKIYIVDEVHMLTTEAFNALLKTLEEPPEHVKFIFATTEPQKLPQTIISRCQKFDFKQINVKTIMNVLDGVCQKESIEVDEDALYAIAKAAKGSLRDGLSILDQLSAMGGAGIKAEDVFGMLGLVETDLIFEMADALGTKDSARALDVVENIITKGKDIKQLTKDLVDHFRHLMVIKVGGKKLGKLVDYPVVLKEQLLEQGNLFALNDILNIIDAFIKVQETARVTENFRIPLETAIARITFNPETGNTPPSPRSAKPSSAIAQKAADLMNDNKGQVNTPSLVKTKPKGKNDEKTESAENPAAEPQAVKPQAPDVPKGVSSEDAPADKPATDTPSAATEDGGVGIADIRARWDAFTHDLSKARMLVATYLQDAQPYELKGNGALQVGFEKEFVFNKEALEDNDTVKLVSDHLSAFFGVSMFVEYHLIDSNMNLAAEEDTEVQSVMKAFGGEVISKWHKEQGN